MDMLQFSLASITKVAVSASIDTLGDVSSSWGMYVHCGHSSAHVRPFTCPHCFSLMIFMAHSALFLFSLDRVSCFTDAKTLMSLR